MNFKSINNLVSDVRKWSKQIDFEYDYILGIPDSGGFVARLLSIYTGKMIDGPSNRGIPFIVDDSLMSGKTMSVYRRDNAKYGAVYIKPGKEKLVDTYYQVLSTPRIFEWGWYKNKHLENTMMDIDGILCRDPTKQECDYGLKMLEFYSTVKPEIVPRRKIGSLVTCRLDKYRTVTMDWLALHGINTGRLIMRRTRSQGHGEFKAKVYKENKAALFIESSLRQSRTIAKLSGKPVLCYSTMEML